MLDSRPTTCSQVVITGTVPALRSRHFTPADRMRDSSRGCLRRPVAMPVRWSSGFWGTRPAGSAAQIGGCQCRVHRARCAGVGLESSRQ